MKQKNALRATENMTFPITMVFNGVEHIASHVNAVKSYASIATTKIIMIDTYGVTKIIK